MVPHCLLNGLQDVAVAPAMGELNRTVSALGSPMFRNLAVLSGRRTMGDLRNNPITTHPVTLGPAAPGTVREA